MNLIAIAIDRPIAVIAAVLMTVMFGLVALQVIPIQLTPDVRNPVITVRTNWPGAAPAEVEREILNKQEDVLRGLEGLEKIDGQAEDGRATVTMEFRIGQDMDKALLLVSNRLDRVGGYPAEADEPTLDTAGSEDNPITWVAITRLPGNERDIYTYGDFVEDVVSERIQRVPGVAGVNVYGGRARELVVTIDPVGMSRYGLTVSQVLGALRAADVATTAGDVEEGKRRYVVRTDSDFSTPERVSQVVLRTIRDAETGRIARVTVGDIAEVGFDYKDQTTMIRRMGEQAVVINAVRDTGANVIETMRGIREAITELNAGVVRAQGLQMKQVYDETVYIDSAIELVRQNIWIGGLLAATILIIFLRSWRATLVVSVAIPVSVIGSFVAMAALGRSINVVSLAGIAFAVGMVVDAAIVVLENVFRLRQSGASPRDAAYKGAAQVWSAVLVSALTTVLVFLPLLVLQLEIGQLFRDIAVAISVSVLLSLVVAVTLIPALSNRLLKGVKSDGSGRIHIPVLDTIASAILSAILAFTRVISRRRSVALVVVVGVCGLSGAASYLFLPKLEYMPEGNRNLIFGIVLPPPGYNLPTTAGIAEDVENAVKDLWVEEKGVKADPDKPPFMDNFFFVAMRGTTFVGASASEPERVAELIPIVRQPVFKEPGTFGFVTQPSLFGRGIGSGRSIDVNISGGDLEQILSVALRATGAVAGALPMSEGNQLRPIPGLELGAPEIRILPDPLRLADNGVSAAELGLTVDAFNDGLRVVEITVDGKQMDLTLKGRVVESQETQKIGSLPVMTSSGTILPVRSLADVEITSGPTEIRHIDRLRTVTLQVRPRSDLPLEAAMELIEEQVVAPLKAAGLPPGTSIRLAGTADKLTEAWDAMVIEMGLALIIVFLVMAVLFESFLYPLIIMLSVPLATAGGVAGLAILNLYQQSPLDMLTLLGFIILVGIVVNNAILLVHQTKYYMMEEGMPAEEALVSATQNRIRPIFMSTLTSVFGMLPLVLFPGAGSELYRGLGSVVLGGLALSAVLTLLIIPAMLSLVLSRKQEVAENSSPGQPALDAQ
ncbi:MAG: efflux RND transporter permease subunit [Magnetospiraceae bacterium]